MPFTSVYWITEYEHSRIGTMARPRGGDWLKDELTALQKEGVGLVVCLLDADEIEELGLMEERMLCYDLDMDYMRFSIPDFDVPESSGDFLDVVEKIDKQLNKGTSVVIHCRMGIGRSTMMAASVLMRKGQSLTDAIQMIQQARGRQVPDTEEQMRFLQKIARMKL
ncbi:MAG: dual specificity protein phosphatase family protein [Bacteroidota bacterium]